MENGQSTTKLGLPPLTPNQQEALQKVTGGGGFIPQPWVNKVAPSHDPHHRSGHVTPPRREG